MNPSGRLGQSVETFAEDLGRLLGTAERKATEWLSQREEVAKQLTELRNKATRLLSQLGLTGVATNSGAGHRRGRRPLSASEAPARRGRPPGKKKRTMSAEARARIAAAQRKRWAKVKSEKGQA